MFAAGDQVYWQAKWGRGEWLKLDVKRKNRTQRLQYCTDCSALLLEGHLYAVSKDIQVHTIHCVRGPM